MNHDTTRNRLRPHILTAIEHGPYETALGYLRYEVSRRLSPYQFAELTRRNNAGEHWDDMIDEEILKWKEGK